MKKQSVSKYYAKHEVPYNPEIEMSSFSWILMLCKNLLSFETSVYIEIIIKRTKDTIVMLNFDTNADRIAPRLDNLISCITKGKAVYADEDFGSGILFLKIININMLIECAL